MRRVTLAAAMIAVLTIGGSTAIAATTITGLHTFLTTDGDVLATTVVDLGGYRGLAIGGHFDHIKRSNGTLVAAKNLAVLRIPDGAVLYAGNANSYVRALYSRAGRLYVGGNFTTLAGQSRVHIASIRVPGWTLTGFTPPWVGVVTSITSVGGKIAYGTSGVVQATAPDTAVNAWSLPVVGGPVRALLADCGTVGTLYVGGLFEQIGNRVQHGLIRLNVPATGTPVIDPTFRPVLHADKVGGTGYDGQEVLSLGCKRPDAHLMVGWGGGTTNGVGAMKLNTGGWWWWRNTVGDLQAIAVLPTSTIVGYHRNHTNDIPGNVAAHGEDGEKWYATEVSSSYGTATAWDPRLIGNTGNNSDGGNGGVQALAYDQADGLLFVAGAFTGTGNCPTTVWPCTAAVSPRQSIAVFGVTA